MQFVIRRPLPPLDRLRASASFARRGGSRFSSCSNRSWRQSGRTCRNALWGWMRASGALPPFPTADIWSASGSLRCEAQSAESSARCRAAGEVRSTAARRRRRFSGHTKARRSRDGRNSIASLQAPAFPSSKFPRPARRRTARALRSVFRRRSRSGSTGAGCAAPRWVATRTRPGTCCAVAAGGTA